MRAVLCPRVSIHSAVVGRTQGTDCLETLAYTKVFPQVSLTSLLSPVALSTYNFFDYIVSLLLQNTLVTKMLALSRVSTSSILTVTHSTIRLSTTLSRHLICSTLNRA